MFQADVDIDNDEPKKHTPSSINEPEDRFEEIEIEPDTKDVGDKEISKNQSPIRKKENSKNDNNPDERPQVTIREKPQGDKIISSPHNTDAEYTRKRKQTVVGHRAFATETCDSDNPFQLITDVNLEKATHPDAKEIVEIRLCTERNGFKPEKMYGDAGFVNDETIIEHKEHGIDLWRVPAQAVLRVLKVSKKKTVLSIWAILRSPLMIKPTNSLLNSVQQGWSQRNKKPVTKQVKYWPTLKETIVLLVVIMGAAL